MEEKQQLEKSLKQLYKEEEAFRNEQCSCGRKKWGCHPKDDCMHFDDRYERQQKIQNVRKELIKHYTKDVMSEMTIRELNTHKLNYESKGAHFNSWGRFLEFMGAQRLNNG